MPASADWEELEGRRGMTESAAVVSGVCAENVDAHFSFACLPGPGCGGLRAHSMLSNTLRPQRYRLASPRPKLGALAANWATTTTTPARPTSTPTHTHHLSRPARPAMPPPRAAAADSGHSGGQATPPAPPALRLINATTKWLVSGTAAALAVHRRDAAVAWCVIGAVAAAFLGKVCMCGCVGVREGRPCCTRCSPPFRPLTVLFIIIIFFHTLQLLKRLINQARPPTAAGVKADPGMPSSHAVSLAFLGSCAAVGLAQGGRLVEAGAVLGVAAGLVS